MGSGETQPLVVDQARPRPRHFPHRAWPGADAVAAGVLSEERKVRPWMEGLAKGHVLRPWPAGSEDPTWAPCLAAGLRLGDGERQGGGASPR